MNGRKKDSTRSLPKFLTNLDPSIYLSENYVIVDVETTRLEGMWKNPDNRLLSVQFCLGPEHPQRKRFGDRNVIIKGNEYEQSYFIDSILSTADFFVAHNTKFELGWFTRCGCVLDQILSYCTMLGEYIILGNRKQPINLDDTLHRYGLNGKENHVANMLKGGMCLSEIPFEYWQGYAAQDVGQLHKLFLEQRRYLDDSGLLPVAFVRNVFTPCLVDIEPNGMTLDPERVGKVTAKISNRLRELETEFSAITGGANPKSVPQMRKVMFEDLKFKPAYDPYKRPILTPAGVELRKQHATFDETEYYAVNADVVRVLVCRNQRQRRFKEIKMEIGKLKDKRSKYLNNMQACIDGNGGTLYASIHQTRTKTHRTSSKGEKYKLQFQNQDNELKPVYKAKYGHFVEVDYSQLEFKMAAVLTQDEPTLELIRSDYDIHRYTASEMYSKDEGDITEEERRHAKRHTFKPLYYGRSGTPEQVAYYLGFKSKYRGIADTQDRWCGDVLRSAKDSLTIASGLRFYFPGTRLGGNSKSPFGPYITNGANIYNFPIQSICGADVVPMALTILWHKMKARGMKSRIINTIHDSILSEVSDEELEEYQTLVKQCLTKHVVAAMLKLYKLDINIPLVVDFNIGSHWHTSKDWEDKWLSTTATT